MIRIIIYFIISAFLFSCKKANPSFNSEEFAGTWEFERYSGYPFTSTPLPPGNGRIIFIGNDGSFERRNFDTILFKSRYTLKNRKDCYGEDKQLFFETSDPFTSVNIIKLENNKLTLSAPNCVTDAGTTIYIRK